MIRPQSACDYYITGTFFLGKQVKPKKMDVKINVAYYLSVCNWFIHEKD